MLGCTPQQERLLIETIRTHAIDLLSVVSRESMKVEVREILNELDRAVEPLDRNDDDNHPQTFVQAADDMIRWAAHRMAAMETAVATFGADAELPSKQDDDE